MLAGVADGADLALDAADAEAAGDDDAVDVVQGARRALGGLAAVGLHPADLHPGAVGEAAGPQRLADGEVGVGQVDVLADERDHHLLLGVVDPLQQVVPAGPVDVAEAQVEAADDVGVQALGVQHLRDVVDARRVDAGDDGLLVDVAHQRDLALDRLGDLAVGAADDGVGLDADLAQRGDRVLGGLGLELTAGADVGHQRDVQEEDVLPADVVADLAGGLEERQRLDVADGAADLVDHHVDVVALGVRPAHGEHGVLDLVGDVRDDLHRVAEVVPAALLGDHRGVDLAGGDVRLGREVDVEEALVVPDVQVGLGAVLGDEDLTVLERVHGAGVHVEVRVQLLHGDAEAAGHQQRAEAGRRQALPERGGDPAGDEQVLGVLLACSHGPPAYVRPRLLVEWPRPAAPRRARRSGPRGRAPPGPRRASRRPAGSPAAASAARRPGSSASAVTAAAAARRRRGPPAPPRRRPAPRCRPPGC